MQHEFRLIDAQRRYEQHMRAHIEVLEIQLRLARGEWVGLKDKWRLKELLEKYPEFGREDEAP